jgi:hypothetical protein
LLDLPDGVFADRLRSDASRIAMKLPIATVRDTLATKDDLAPQLASQLFTRLMKDDPEAALASNRSKEVEGQKEIVRQLRIATREGRPDHLVGWLAFVRETKDRQVCVREIARRWAVLDLAAGLHWVLSLADEAERGVGLTGLIYGGSVAERPDFPALATIVAKIEARDDRKSLAHVCCREWMKVDPAAAIAAVETFQLIPNDDQRLRESLERNLKEGGTR